MIRHLTSRQRPFQSGHIIKTLTMAALLLLAFPSLAEKREKQREGQSEGGYRLLELDGYKVKWGEKKLGVGASISYALADETMHFDDARNCRELAPMTNLAGQDLSLETLELEAEAAFRVWERAADLSFHKVANARDADIILGAQGQPRRHAFANVTYAPDEKEGVRALKQGLVCLNSDQKWKVGFGGNAEAYDLRYTLIHEIGHAIGLDHPGPSGQVMGFRYTEDFPELQPGDLRGVRQLYGHRADDSQLAARTDTRIVKPTL